MTEISFKIIVSDKCAFFVKNSKAVCKTLKISKILVFGRFLVSEADLGYLCTR